MAKPSGRNKKTVDETAASVRPTRTPVKSALSSKVTKTTPSSGAKRGRPAGFVAVEKVGRGETSVKKMKKGVSFNQSMTTRSE